MHVISRSSLIAYYTKNPQAKIALEDWYVKTSRATWNSFADIKRTFNSVDNVGRQHYVFNIKGNDYRLVVVFSLHLNVCISDLWEVMQNMIESRTYKICKIWHR